MKKSFLLTMTTGLVAFSLSAQTVADYTATTACFGQQTAFAASSNIPDSSVVSWKWDMDNDGNFSDAFGKTVFYTFPKDTVFKVVLRIETKGGGTKDTSKNVSVNPLPNVNFKVDNLCEGKAAIYISTSTISKGSVTQYIWDFDNNGVADDITSGDTARYTCGPAQKYQTKLECVSDKGCKAFAIKTTEVFNQPNAKFTVANTCFNDSTEFVNQTSLKNETMDFYLWNFGDNSQHVAAVLPKHIYNTTGNYTATLIASSKNNCRDTVSVSLVINPLPAVSFTFTGDTVLYEGNEVSITAEGNVVAYLWNTGATTKSITTGKSGTVSVKATDGNGCSSSKEVTVTVKKVKEVGVENNVITPNNDGTNDYLVIDDLAAYKNCELAVYNLWNDVVYKNSNYQNDWQGTYNNGKPLDAGTYFYIIKCAGRQETTGSINILR